MNYSQIIPHDCANGEGWRTTLFVSGCDFHCPGCFNPESQNFDCGEPFTMYTMANILDMVKDDKVSGLSILGGDPLCQDISDLIKLIDLCKRVRYIGKTVWLWSGFTFEQLFSPYNNYEEVPQWKYRQKLIEHVDIFIDGPFTKEQKDLTLKWRGSKNQRVIDVQKTIQQNKIILYEGDD